jgi:single-stranded-DNA-specific exonuclease
MDVLIEIPKPKIKARKRDAAVEQNGLDLGLHPVIARIVAARPIFSELPLLQAISPKLSNLSTPIAMADIELAAERVASAILDGECIGIETDHDCDGQTSHAVLYHNLVNRFGHPTSKIRSYIGHRLTEGYGLSDHVASRILEDTPRPALVITADNGSSDEPRIARLKAGGIDVIVTDHHAIPLEGYPKSAYACLNPTRADCGYNDPYIAGCMVAWLLMTATRKKLIERNRLPTTEPNLSDSLDFVAVGTVADCVSIARSANNRAVVSYGLRLIEKGIRPCWRAFNLTLKTAICSDDVGFRLGPLLNSDGRLSTAFGSVSFLLSESDEEAHHWLEELQSQNEHRKLIQRQIVEQAIKAAKVRLQKQYFSLSLYLPEGHSGVQGIAASRIKDLFGRPTAIFALKQGTTDLLTGSVRGIEQFHVREALQFVAERDPTILLAFGGHKGAGGLTLLLSNIERFVELFEMACKEQLQLHAPLEPIIWTDGHLSSNEFHLNFLAELTRLEPYGREFELPIFELKGILKEIRSVGDGTHARIMLEVEKQRYSGIWFGARVASTEAFSVTAGDSVQVAFSIKENIFRQKRSLDIQVVYMQRVLI